MINLEVPMFMTVGPEVFYLRGIIFSILQPLFQFCYTVSFISLTGYEEDFKFKRP